MMDTSGSFSSVIQYNSMKINPEFKLREIAGETVVVRQGEAGADLTRIVSLNASARLLYERLSSKEFTTEEAAGILVAAYHIEADQAARDAAAWVEALRNCRLIEE